MVYISNGRLSIHNKFGIALFFHYRFFLIVFVLYLSYKFFYDDGYGKESLILNMNGEAYEQAMHTVAAQCPLEKVSDPDDIAAAVLSLVNGSPMVTGTPVSPPMRIGS